MSSVVTVTTGGEIVENKAVWSGPFGCINDDEDVMDISNEFKRVVYKQCGYRVNPATVSPSKGFEILHVFNNDSFPNGTSEFDDNEIIILFGKNIGKAGNENKYDFPPPIDTNLFYGKLCLVKATIDDSDDNLRLFLGDLTLREWEKTYAALFGGFHDCDEEEDYESDDNEDIYAELPSTKDGYAKDGFVVADDDEDEFSEYGCESDDEYCFTDED